MLSTIALLGFSCLQNFPDAKKKTMVFAPLSSVLDEDEATLVVVAREDDEDEDDVATTEREGRRASRKARIK